MAANKFKLRRNAGGRKGNRIGTVMLDGSSTKSVAEQLKEVLVSNRARVLDLFREWDEDGDGLVTQAEFRAAVKALGYSAVRADVDLLFSQFDKDGSGVLEFGELNSMLRKAKQGGALPAKLRHECSSTAAGAGTYDRAAAAVMGGTAPAAMRWLPREAGLPPTLPSVQEQMQRSAEFKAGFAGPHAGAFGTAPFGTAAALGYSPRTAPMGPRGVPLHMGSARSPRSKIDGVFSGVEPGGER